MTRTMDADEDRHRFLLAVEGLGPNGKRPPHRAAARTEKLKVSALAACAAAAALEAQYGCGCQGDDGHMSPPFRGWSDDKSTLRPRECKWPLVPGGASGGASGDQRQPGQQQSGQ